MELTSELKNILIETAEILKGYARRHFMAEAVKALGKGGASQAEKELGWNRTTIRKGLEELEGQFCYIGRFHERGRKPTEAHLPTLLSDIKEVVDGTSQTAPKGPPTFKTTQLYTRLSVVEVRRQLIEQKGYTPEELPSDETLRQKLNQLGYKVKRVQKKKPLKKIAETDAIFDEVKRVNEEADADEETLRLSMDAKASLQIGPFSRGGLTRVVVKALDHDFQDGEKVTPFGIFLPQYDELFLYFTTSKVTSEFIVDCLTDFWQSEGHRFPKVKTLVLNLDNGPENHSRRGALWAWFMLRLTQFTDTFRISVQLAYYPPYHSKYNPIERVWAVLERHWNGSLLDSLDTILNFARSMSYKKQHPQVNFVQTIYRAGQKLSQAAMRLLELRFQRLQNLEKWFVRIVPLDSFYFCLSG